MILVRPDEYLSRSGQDRKSDHSLWGDPSIVPGVQGCECEERDPEHTHTDEREPVEEEGGIETAGGKLERGGQSPDSPADVDHHEWQCARNPSPPPRGYGNDQRYRPREQHDVDDGIVSECHAIHPFTSAPGAKQSDEVEQRFIHTISASSGRDLSQ